MRTFQKINTKGFFLIEVLVSVFIITVIIIFVLGSIYDTVSVTKRSLERTQAAFLLEEGAEVLRFSRSVDWTTISNMIQGQSYGLTWNGSTWQVVSGAQSIGAFSRSIICEAVQRNAQDTIVSSGGTVDEGTRLCTVTVSWNTQSGIRQETLSFYITNTTL